MANYNTDPVSVTYGDAISKAACRCNDFSFINGYGCTEITKGYILALADIFDIAPQAIEEDIESKDWSY